MARGRLELELADEAADAGDPLERAEEGVAHGRGPAAAAEEDVAHADADVDHGLGVLAPLELVGVEDLGAGGAAGGEGELPGDVGDVAEAGHEALAHEGGHLVGGVAEQEDRADLPALGDVLAEAIDGGAGDLVAVGVDEGRDQLAQAGRRLERGGVLPRHHHQLDPHLAVRTEADEGGSIRVAHEAGVREAQRGLGGEAGDREPGLLVARAVHLDADEPADEAAGAVAAEDEARPHARAGVARGDLEGGVVVGAGEAAELAAEVDRDAREAPDAVAEDGLEGGLVEEVEGGVAGAEVDARELDLGEGAVADADVVDPPRRDHVLAQPVDEADLLVDPERLVVA